MERNKNAVQANHTTGAAQPHGDFLNVILTPAEVEKLHTRLGRDTTENLIEELSTYMAAKRTHYKSHFAVLLMWARKHDAAEYEMRRRFHRCDAICFESGCPYRDTAPRRGMR